MPLPHVCVMMIVTLTSAIDDAWVTERPRRDIRCRRYPGRRTYQQSRACRCRGPTVSNAESGERLKRRLSPHLHDADIVWVALQMRSTGIAYPPDSTAHKSPTVNLKDSRNGTPDPSQDAKTAGLRLSRCGLEILECLPVTVQYMYSHTP
eukprot:668606-Rhodomonas_salina.3